MIVKLREIPLPKGEESLVEILQCWLAKARNDEIRSIAIVGVSSDGSAVPTAWSIKHGDFAELVALLATLQVDIIGARS